MDTQISTGGDRLSFKESAQREYIAGLQDRCDTMTEQRNELLEVCKLIDEAYLVKDDFYKREQLRKIIAKYEGTK
jgi:hypothetical protein